jgi:Ca2+-transporting ATPase
MIQNIAGQALLQISLIGVILVFPMGLKPHSQKHYTFLFTVFVLCQMFNLVNARAVGKGDDPTIGIFDTPLFPGIMLGIGVVQVILVQVAGQFFSCTPLGFREWALCLALAALTWPLGWGLRRVSIRSQMKPGRRFGLARPDPPRHLI